MRSVFRLLILATLGGLSCKPNVGRTPSLIVGPEILAMRGQPAEADQGQNVTYDFLIVSPEGNLGEVAAAWDVCLTPKTPSESNAVASDCVLAPAGDTVGTTFKAPVPTNACSLFGPIAPPQQGDQKFRPRDPDSTGGYYVPVRAVVQPPVAERSLIAFDLERVHCKLSGAPLPVIQDFNSRYRLNSNPRLQALVTENIEDVLAGGVSIGSGSDVSLIAIPSADSIEVFPVYDPASQTLVDQQESLRYFWYSPQGEFEHDRTGIDSGAEDGGSTNLWTAPIVAQPTTVPLWIVLRDSRGGTDFLSAQVTVTP